ncbi:hypothetical protein LXL04_038342 [Taraxacum kok-saghyz]
MNRRRRWSAGDAEVELESQGMPPLVCARRTRRGDGPQGIRDFGNRRWFVCARSEGSSVVAASRWVAVVAEGRDWGEDSRRSRFGRGDLEFLSVSRWHLGRV